MPKNKLMEMTAVSIFIAIIVSILHGINPSSVSFNVSSMRRHLQQELKKKKITVFPPVENCLLSKSLQVLEVTGIPIFCTCWMPEHVFMFTCTVCKNGFILAISTLPKLKS